MEEPKTILFIVNASNVILNGEQTKMYIFSNGYKVYINGMTGGIIPSNTPDEYLKMINDYNAAANAPEKNSSESSYGQGKLGGWLIVFILALAGRAIWYVVSALVPTSFDKAACTPFFGKTFCDSVFNILLVTQVATYLIAGASIVVLIMFLRKNPKSARVGFWYLVIGAAIEIGCSLFAYFTMEKLPVRYDKSDWPMVIAEAVLYAGIWAPYLCCSKRVKNTFEPPFK